MPMQGSTHDQMKDCHMFQVRSSLFDIHVRKYSRNRPAMQTLDSENRLSVGAPNEGQGTYNPPRRKIPITESFCAMGICSFRTIGIGHMRMMKSVRTLKAPLAMKKA